MQKIAPHTLPPNASQSGGMSNRQPAPMQAAPPALLLARRIRREQGVEQVKRFLMAMEPFLAPYERQAIAEQLGIRLPPPPPPPGSPPQKPEESCRRQERPSATPSAPPPLSQGPNMNQQLLQLLGQMAGGSMGTAANAGGINPMLLSQLLGGMNQNH